MGSVFIVATSLDMGFKLVFLCFLLKFTRVGGNFKSYPVTHRTIVYQKAGDVLFFIFLSKLETRTYAEKIFFLSEMLL